MSISSAIFLKDADLNWGADLLALNIDGNMPYDLCDDDDTLILVETEMAKRHVTQKQIDEIRLGPEKEMLSDLKRHYAAGDDLQALDVQGAAPIHVAAACGYPEVTRYLLQLNLEPQLPDQDGWLPIHIAVSWGHSYRVGKPCNNTSVVMVNVLVWFDTRWCISSEICDQSNYFQVLGTTDNTKELINLISANCEHGSSATIQTDESYQSTRIGLVLNEKKKYSSKLDKKARSTLDAFIAKLQVTDCKISNFHDFITIFFGIELKAEFTTLEVIEILVAYGADLNATTKNGQTVYAESMYKAGMGLNANECSETHRNTFNSIDDSHSLPAPIRLPSASMDQLQTRRTTVGSKLERNPRRVYESKKDRKRLIGHCSSMLVSALVMIGKIVSLARFLFFNTNVLNICDSKELQMRLKEVWDRREDLRSTVKKTSLSVNNNGNSNFTRGFGSSRRKSNTSIMRTSMRDKRRITRVDAERERQLGEQLASAVATKENGGSVEKVANITTAPSSPKSLSASVNANANTTNSNSTTLVALASNSRKSLSGGPESKQTPEVNGIGSTTARRGNDSNTTAPAVPPRNTRPVRLSDGPLASQSSSITTSASTLSVNDQHTKTSSSSTSTDNSTVTSNSTASNSSSASPSTFTETPESESSDSSRSNYVRPMQRNSNGQMVPIVNTTTTNNSDSARSPPSQRSRPTPPSRDNRSRTPGRSGVSVGSSASSYGSPRGQRVNTTAGAAAAAQLPPSNPTVLRQGPLPQQPQNEIPRPKANNVTSPSSFISTETLNSDYGSGGRKPFLCCHTM
ncbi:hypothetical protein ACTXT7_012321 [Hymenolepis weldensis]